MQPTRNGYINAVQVYPYATGALYQVYAAPGQVTDIALQEGEQLVGSGPVAAGDTVRWIIGDTESGTGPTKRVHILVKPTRPDLVTNLVINTDRRTYHLELRSTEKTYMASVSWQYPQDQLIALRRQNAVAEAAAPVDTGARHRQAQFPLRDRRRHAALAAAARLRRRHQGLHRVSTRHSPGRDAAALRHRSRGGRRARQLSRARQNTMSSIGCSPPPNFASAAIISRRSASSAPTGDRDGERRSSESRARACGRPSPPPATAAGDTAFPQGSHWARGGRHHCRPAAPSCGRSMAAAAASKRRAQSSTIPSTRPRPTGLPSCRATIAVCRPACRRSVRRCREISAAPMLQQAWTSKVASIQSSNGLAQETEAARTSRLFAPSTTVNRAPLPPLSTTPTPSGAFDVSGEKPPIDADSLQNMQDRKLAFLNGPIDKRTVSSDRLAGPASKYIVQAGAVIPAALLTGHPLGPARPGHRASHRKCL